MSEEPKQDLGKLIGVHQDLILDVFGRPRRITKAGRDENGLVVRWHYKEFRLTLSRVTAPEPKHGKVVSVYVVTKVDDKRGE